MRLIIIVIFLFFSNIAMSQTFCDTAANENHKIKVDALGIRRGHNFHGLSLAIAVTPSYRENINGALIGGILATGAKRVNGVVVGGIYTFVEKLNGVGIVPYIGKIDTLNGFCLGISIFSQNARGATLSLISGSFGKASGFHIAPLGWFSSNFNGVSLSLINVNKQYFKGVQLGVFNKTQTGRCVQIGIINYIKENPKGLRILPLINMRFAHNE
jgi:hypothetical protein